ncbi:MAG: BatA domain-containing protein [Anaerolineae bacterium]|nr:BatA domain-containing protein [Anaerolineae bacterium]
MNALNPIGLALALLAIPIVLLYLLRLRRQEQQVSGTLLWRQTVMDRRGECAVAAPAPKHPVAAAVAHPRLSRLRPDAPMRWPQPD